MKEAARPLHQCVLRSLWIFFFFFPRALFSFSFFCFFAFLWALSHPPCLVLPFSLPDQEDKGKFGQPPLGFSGFLFSLEQRTAHQVLSDLWNEKGK